MRPIHRAGLATPVIEHQDAERNETTTKTATYPATLGTFSPNT